MITFVTRSGSIYEVDVKNSKCRRLSGKLGATDRQGPDGEWKEFHNTPEIKLDEPVVFMWPRRGPDDPWGAPATVTSPVKEILIVNVQ